MVTKYYVEDDDSAFSLVEEEEYYRLKVVHADIDDDDVEDFLDTTVEWLSSNPEKGILIDFSGVRTICPDFAVELQRNYEEIKRKGIYVRFVNVAPALEPYINVQNITVAMTVFPEKPVVSARKVMLDLARNMPDEDLMRKYSLTPKGLRSLFRKLVRKGLITKHDLAQRMGIETGDVPATLVGHDPKKAAVNASDVLRDIEHDVSDSQLMRKYKLTNRGLESLMTKLRQRGLISQQTLLRRRRYGL